MTTIIYDHKRKQIACDGRVSADGVIFTDDCDKWDVCGKGILFSCGADHDVPTILKAIDTFEHKEATGGEVDASGLLVTDDGIFEVGVMDCAIYYTKSYYSYGMGSGGYWALAALDHGKTAAKAVEYASTRDSCTGGKISVYDIKKGKFV